MTLDELKERIIEMARLIAATHTQEELDPTWELRWSDINTMEDFARLAAYWLHGPNGVLVEHTMNNLSCKGRLALERILENEQRRTENPSL